MVRFFKNKKNLLIFAFFASFLISGTFAVSQDSAVLRNLFHLGYYKTVNFEEFVSPDNWKTCDVTPKTVNVRNESNMKVAVRISYEEFWKAADGETDLPLEKDGVTLAEIIFQNEDDWELRGGYYYYKADLESDQTTSSLFEAVKLSCDANLVSDEQTCTQTATGTVCTDPDERYNGAHYHLKVKIETIQVEGKAEWEPDESAMIYGAIKKKSTINGIDSGLNFGAQATVATGNGNGINIRAGTQNDEHPIYYFRGEVDDNNIIWGGYCWKILRTTETGGTKLMYSGLVNNGQCSNNNARPSRSYGDDTLAAGMDIADFYTPYNDIYAEDVDEYESPIGYAGYMYDELQLIWSKTNPSYNLSGTVYLSKSIEYGSDNQYHLVNPVAITVAKDDPNDEDHTNVQTYVANGYYYSCSSTNATVCAKAHYSILEPSFYRDGTLYGYYLENGDLLPDLRRKLTDSNKRDSMAKALVDNWYELNIKNKDFESDLEDTVFCNDRNLTNWSLKSESYPLYDFGYDYWPSKFQFNAGQRLLVNKTPTYECSNNVDRFTVGSSIGNAELSYPVAIMSGDEMQFAGVTENLGGANGTVYPFGLSNWGFAMTPIGIYSMGSLGMGMGIYVGDMSDSTRLSAIEFYEIVRPVVSLKYGTEIVEGGEGTLDNPYVVK